MYCLTHKQEDKCNKDIAKTTSNNQRNTSSARRRHQRCSLAWLPICTAALGLITILVTYTFAVTKDHIFPLLPYISDTGIEFPESSIFCLCLDIVATLLVLTAYVRHKLIGQFHHKLPAEPRYQRIGRVNGASFIVGVVAAGGLMVLANFPEDENLMVHLMGAFFCFLFGVVYCCLHTWLSFKTSPEFSPPWMCFFRLILTTFTAITLALVILFGTVLRWNSDDCNPQINYRQTSALFEWLLVATFHMYFMTFALEFHKMRMSTKVRVIRRDSSRTDFSQISSPPPSPTPSSAAEEKKQIEALLNQQNNIGHMTELCYHGNGIIHVLSKDHMCVVKAGSPV